MFQNDRISKLVRKMVRKIQNRKEEVNKIKTIAECVPNKANTTNTSVYIEEPLKKYIDPVEEKQKIKESGK